MDSSTPGLQGGHHGHQHLHGTQRGLQDWQETLLQGTTAGSKGVWSLKPFFKLQLRVATREKLLVLARGGEVQEEFAYELFL